MHTVRSLLHVEGGFPDRDPPGPRPLPTWQGTPCENITFANFVYGR